MANRAKHLWKKHRFFLLTYNMIPFSNQLASNTSPTRSQATILYTIALKLFKNFRLSVFCMMAVLSMPINALPTGITQISGITSVVENIHHKTLEITSHQERAHIRFEDYKIAPGEKVHYLQPNTRSILLNEIVGGNIAHIQGSIISNGGIILQNPAGILFSEDARVDVAGLLATTALLENTEGFLQGENQLKFHQKKVFEQEYAGSIINHGEIILPDIGLGALFIAPHVENQKIIKALRSVVNLSTSAYQTQFFISLAGDGLINFEVKSNDINNFSKKKKNKFTKTLIEEKNTIINQGNIEADTIFIEIGSAKEVVDASINLNGHIQANSIILKNGQVSLQGQNLNNMVQTDASKQKNLHLKESLEKLNEKYKEKKASKDNLQKHYDEIKKNSELMFTYLKEADDLSKKAEKENFDVLSSLKEKLLKYQQKGIAANPVDVRTLQSNLKQIETSVSRARNAIKRTYNNITKESHESFELAIKNLNPILIENEKNLAITEASHKTAQIAYEDNTAALQHLIATGKKSSTHAVVFNKKTSLHENINATLACIEQGNFILKKANFSQGTRNKEMPSLENSGKVSEKTPAFLTELKRNLPEKVAAAEPLYLNNPENKAATTRLPKEPEIIIIENLQAITEAYDKASKAFSDSKHAQKQAEEILQKSIDNQKQKVQSTTSAKKFSSHESGGLGGLLDAIKGFQQKKLKKVAPTSPIKKSFKTPFGSAKLRTREESEKIWQERQKRRKVVATRHKPQSESILIKQWLDILSNTDIQKRNEIISVMHTHIPFNFTVFSTNTLPSFFEKSDFVQKIDNEKTVLSFEESPPSSPFSLEKKRKLLNKTQTIDKSHPILYAEFEQEKVFLSEPVVSKNLTQQASPKSLGKRKISDSSFSDSLEPIPFNHNVLLYTPTSLSKESSNTPSLFFKAPFEYKPNPMQKKFVFQEPDSTRLNTSYSFELLKELSFSKPLFLYPFSHTSIRDKFKTNILKITVLPLSNFSKNAKISLTNEKMIPFLPQSSHFGVQYSMYNDQLIKTYFNSFPFLFELTSLSPNDHHAQQ